MKKSYPLILILLLLGSGWLLSCGELGQVDQGRAIAFDPVKKTVTIIREKNAGA